jgi:hypothetical protein
LTGKSPWLYGIVIGQSSLNGRCSIVLPKDVGKIMGNMMIHLWILGVCSMLAAESDIPFLLGNLNDKSLIKGSFMEETPSYGGFYAH